MRLTVLSLMVLAMAGCSRQTDNEKAKAAEELAIKERYQNILAETQAVAQQERERLEMLRKPVLDPKGVTAEQAALDNACDRRSQLPRAMPYPEHEAIAATGHARVEDDKLVVGRFTFDWLPEDFADGEGEKYVGRYAGLPVDIVLSHGWDSIGWRVLDQNSGELLGGGLPIPSPTGEYWAQIQSFEAPDGAIFIYTRHPSGWKKEASFPIESACDAKWLDEVTLTFRDNAGHPYRHDDPYLGPFRRITRAGDAWVVM